MAIYDVHGNVLSESDIVVDKTLTEDGQAADAKVTGDRLDSLSEEMPDKLPNPNPLTFSGVVTGTYDGSAPLSVEIPSGGGTTEWVDDLLESGTLYADTAVDYTTNVNLAKLREYKSISFSLRGKSNVGLSDLYLRIDGISVSRGGSSGRIVRFEWADSEKKVLRITEAFDGNSSLVSLGSVAVASWNTWTTNSLGATSILRYVDLSNVNSEAFLKFECGVTPTIDYEFEIRGMTK